MDCEEENAVDTSHFFNVTLELGKGWTGTGAAQVSGRCASLSHFDVGTSSRTPHQSGARFYGRIKL